MAKVKLKHLLTVFLIALGAFCLLLWPTQNDKVYFWQDKLFSAGSVSLAHQNDNQGQKIFCQGCHQPGKAITNMTCRQCHNRQYFEQNQPFLVDSHQIFDRHDYCLHCHTEHHGNYLHLKTPGFSAREHKSLTIKTDKCLDCHRLDGKQAHPVLTKEDCGSCHKNYQWTSEFIHKDYLAKAPNVDKLLALCQECHKNGYHYTIGLRAAEGCIFCHEFWIRRQKQRPVPFPEKVFENIKVNTKYFQI